VPAAGGAPRQLTRGDADADPQWTPDDLTIVFASGRPGKSQIYRIAIDGGEDEKLTDAPHGASSPRISHDGTRIVFSRTDEDQSPPAVVDWKALGFTPSAKQRTTDLRRIDRIHFEDNGRGETFSVHEHLGVMRLDGTGQQVLTGGPFSEYDPVWSADDRALVFVSARHGANDFDREDLYTIPAAGGIARRIPLAHRSQDGPVFLHDGRLAYNMNSHNDPAALPAVQIADLDGTHDTTVVPENTVVFGDAILADTRFLTPAIRGARRGTTR
jgi:Tol biopolymer transport system component